MENEINEDEDFIDEEPHEFHWSLFGTYWCDTCDSPYCNLIQEDKMEFTAKQAEDILFSLYYSERQLRTNNDHSELAQELRETINDLRSPLLRASGY